MATKIKNSEGVKLLINEVAKAVGVSPKELIEYYEWKANLKKLKTKKITRKEIQQVLNEWKSKRTGISEEKAIEIYYEAEEEIKRWKEIERKLKKLGLE
ncbi:hypothetical protein [Thermococcus barophilus]|uniref:Uncharacterized protein n=1 Tax=Thermococcus barophilus (strain DSM 11836 / MP) TaxID=391623 RepID=F0LI37_THEBM|nr:hypothetical protein [Thermococcus barophilus]ADT83191.1 hypothetical protein TERMP_00214 [Thermococcus barophilus MP]